MTEIVLEGHFDAADRVENEFPLLPFEVPPGIARLHVRYQVSRQLSGDKAGWQEGNIVDIGLFDPRGAEFLTAKGFRGWSGTSCQEFTISGDEATPGYLAGSVTPGTWHVVLGLYQTAPEGCDYQVTVTLEDQEDGSAVASSGQQQTEGWEHGSRGAGSDPRWYRGDLHDWPGPSAFHSR